MRRRFSICRRRLAFVFVVMATGAASSHVHHQIPAGIHVGPVSISTWPLGCSFEPRTSLSKRSFDWMLLRADGQVTGCLKPTIPATFQWRFKDLFVPAKDRRGFCRSNLNALRCWLHLKRLKRKQMTAIHQNVSASFYLHFFLLGRIQFNQDGTIPSAFQLGLRRASHKNPWDCIEHPSAADGIDEPSWMNADQSFSRHQLVQTQTGAELISAHSRRSKMKLGYFWWPLLLPISEQRDPICKLTLSQEMDRLFDSLSTST